MMVLDFWGKRYMNYEELMELVGHEKGPSQASIRGVTWGEAYWRTLCNDRMQ